MKKALSAALILFFPLAARASGGLQDLPGLVEQLKKAPPRSAYGIAVMDQIAQVIEDAAEAAGQGGKTKSKRAPGGDELLEQSHRARALASMREGEVKVHKLIRALERHQKELTGGDIEGLTAEVGQMQAWLDKLSASEPKVDPKGPLAALVKARTGYARALGDDIQLLRRRLGSLETLRRTNRAIAALGMQGSVGGHLSHVEGKVVDQAPGPTAATTPNPSATPPAPGSKSTQLMEQTIAATPPATTPKATPEPSQTPPTPASSSTPAPSGARKSLDKIAVPDPSAVNPAPKTAETKGLIKSMMSTMKEAIASATAALKPSSKAEAKPPTEAELWAQGDGLAKNLQELDPKTAFKGFPVCFDKSGALKSLNQPGASGKLCVTLGVKPFSSGKLEVKAPSAAALSSAANEILKRALQVYNDELGINQAWNQASNDKNAANALKPDNLDEMKTLANVMRASMPPGSGSLDRIFYDQEGDIPHQGIKLHIGDPGSTEGRRQLLSEFIRLYQERLTGKMRFKVCLLMPAMQGTQEGKFITIYPLNNEAAREIADTIQTSFLDSQLSLAMPKDDLPYGDGRLVSWRYGCFTGMYLNFKNAKGQHESIADDRDDPKTNLAAAKNCGALDQDPELKYWYDLQKTANKSNAPQPPPRK